MFYFIVIVLLSSISYKTKINSTSSISGEINFIEHLRRNINFIKCKHYVSQNFNTYSKRQKDNIYELHNKLTGKGVKFYYLIDVMENKGHSKDLAYTLLDVNNISGVYNEFFEHTLIEAIEYSKNSKFKTDSEEYFEKGQLHKISKSFDGKNHYNNYFQENNEDGQILSFYVTADKRFSITFIKDENDNYLNKELKIFGDNLAEESWSFSETYDASTNTTFYHFSFGTSINSLMVTVKNNEITSMEQNISCACPDGPKPDHGTSKEFTITLIDYDLAENGNIDYAKYWDDGKYYINNDWVFNLKNNTYYNVEFFDNNRKDTLSYEEGITKIKMANNQTKLYGIDPFMDNRFSKRKVQWAKEWVDEKEIKFRSALTEFDDNGQQISRTYYFPNGRVKSIEK